MLALSNKAAVIAKESAQRVKNESKVGKKPVKGGRDWLEEMVTKQEILDRVGIVDPVIQSNIESTLSNISYKGKTKLDVTEDIVTDLEKQIEKLKYQRVKMMQSQVSVSNDENQNELYPEEVEFQKAMKEKDMTKIENLVERGRSKLDELQRKWEEKRGLDHMRESGLLNSNNYRLLNQSQESRAEQKISTSNERKTSRTPPKQRRIEGGKDSKRSTIFPQDIGDKDEDVQDLIARSEKLTMIDPKRVQFQNKLSDYLTNKKLQTETSVFFEQKERKKFERFQSPASHKKTQERLEKLKITESPLTHLPISHKGEKDGQFEKENIHLNFQEKEPLGKINKKKVHDINELFIIKLVFDALNQNKSGRVSKEEVLDYVMGNKEIITIFEIKSAFEGEVLNFKSEVNGKLSFQELSKLMMKRLPTKTQKNITSAFTQNRPKSVSTLETEIHQDSLLLQKEIELFREIFDNLDQYEDLLLRTEVFLKALRNDFRVQALMEKPAVRIPVVNRELTVRDILAQIDSDYLLSLEDGMETMQYISWNQFLDYFRNYKESKLTRAQQRRPEAQEKVLSEDQLQIVQDIFDCVPRVAEDYVDKLEFVRAAKLDPQLHSFWKQRIHEEGGKTVESIFDDILGSDLTYVKWEEMLPFFLKKEIQEMENEDETATKEFQGQTTKSKSQHFDADHISEAGVEEESQMQSHVDDDSPNAKKGRGEKSALNIQNQKVQQKQSLKARDLKKFEELDGELKREYEQLQIDLRSYGVVKANTKDEKGLTIPKPFKFQERDEKAKSTIRKQKVDEMVEQKRKEEENALNFKFKANPLPASVKIPMYNGIVKANEERRMEVVEKSKQITLANQKPFSFYERDLQKQKSLPQEPSFTQFKANPIPQSSKIEIFKEKEEQEKKAREERIKARAEENAQQVKMPPRMEAHEKAKKEGTLAQKAKNPKSYQPEEATFKPNINTTVPNFEQLNSEFSEKLQKKKQERPKTEFKPFEFQKAAENSRIAQREEEEEPANKRKKKQRTEKPKKKGAEGRRIRGEEEDSANQANEDINEQNYENNNENQEEDEYGQDPDFNGDNDEEGQDEYTETMSKKRRERDNGEEEEKGDQFQFEEHEEIIGDQNFNPALQQRSQKEPEANKSKGSLKGDQTQESEKSETKERKPKQFLTKKLEQESMKRKQEREAREKRMEDMKEEEKQRKIKEKEFAPKVLTAYKTVNKVDKREEENKERIREAKESMKRQQEHYNETIKEMKNKVESAPLMIEKRLYGSRLLNKYRDAIAKGWETLEGPPTREDTNKQSKQDFRETHREDQKDIQREEEQEPVHDQEQSENNENETEEHEPVQEEQAEENQNEENEPEDY